MNAIQKETEVSFMLAHSALISKTLLGEKLCYLSDKAIALGMMLNLYEFPEKMDEATALILHKIGKMGMKLVTSNGRHIIVTPTEFKKFWQCVR